MHRLGTALLVLVAFSTIPAPAPAQPTQCEDRGESCDDDDDDDDDDGVCRGRRNRLACEAGGPCRAPGICLGSTCVSAPLPDGTGCDDGNPCTPASTCRDGVCTGSGSCDDGNPCTTDACTGGGCAHTSIPGCRACPTGGCDDGEACTVDTCENGVCVFRNAGPIGCSDGNACTRNDVCRNGACVGGDPVVCNASDQCHDAGVCNPATGTCSNPPRQGGCDDGNACTTNDTCQNGTCAGTPKTCPAQDACRLPGTCNPQSGACTNPAAPDDTPCDDGDACSVFDRCRAGACTPGLPRNCDDQDHCTADSCSNGTCEHTPQSGCIQCGFGRPPCNDRNACTTDSCVAARCQFTPHALACDDGAACTVGDRCVAGRCVGDPLHDRCTAGECLAGRCDPTARGAGDDGCATDPAPEGAGCRDDGIACTDDVCTATGCEHVPVSARCTAANDCTVATCVPDHAAADAEGCISVRAANEGAECTEDGDPCTDDACAAGACAHAPAGEPASCRPVEGPYHRARELLDLARGLQTLVGAVVTPGDASGPDARSVLMDRLGPAETDLEATVRMLAGRATGTPEPPRNGRTRPAPLDETIAQQRGRIAFAQVKKTPAKVRAFLSQLGRAKRRADLSAAVARELRGRGRSLLTGTKALKRDLKRLQRVNQVFAR